MPAPYGVAIHREDGDYVAKVRDLPEVVTAGNTREEALALAADAIEVAVAGRIDDDMDLPPPSPLRRGEVPIDLPAQLAAKAAIYRAFRAT